MGVPVNAIVELTFRSTLFNQRVLNVWHYMVTTQSSDSNIVTEMEHFLDQVVSLTPPALAAVFVDAMPANMVIDEVVAQVVRPTRYIRVTRSANYSGSRGEATTANVQGSITFRTSLAGRRFVGRKSIPLAASDIEDGLVSVTQRSALQGVADSSILNVVAAIGGGVYDPVLPHFSVPNTAPTRLQSGFAQRTVRVQRRRTVGLGE